MEKRMVVYSAQQTRELGKRLGELCFENCVITLSGDLGAGKTTLTQGLAQGLGIQKTISSPTFTILKIYQGRLPLYHFDAYRLEGSDEDLGFEEMIDGDGVAVIEWPEFMSREIPEEALRITMRRLEQDQRELFFNAVGKSYETMLEELK